MKERAELSSELLNLQGLDSRVLQDPETAHIMAIENSLVSSRAVEGLDVEVSERPDGIDLKVVVEEDVIIKRPVHVCFGVLHRRALQRIKIDLTLKEGSRANFIAHCLFPNAEEVKHLMDASILIGEGAQMHYTETHYHGIAGGAVVVPRARVKVLKAGKYTSLFELKRGRVGSLEIDYDVEAMEDAVVELIARVFGHGDDRINIKERAVLSGERARGLIKTRIALENEAKASVEGITEAKAAHARGHVDCLEIVKDSAIAKAVPVVEVEHSLAKVTHEAAIGSIDRHQLETLMARGLRPEKAVEVIVEGLLR